MVSRAKYRLRLVELTISRWKDEFRVTWRLDSPRMTQGESRTLLHARKGAHLSPFRRGADRYLDCAAKRPRSAIRVIRSPPCRDVQKVIWPQCLRWWGCERGTLSSPCPFLARNGNATAVATCPLSGEKVWFTRPSAIYDHCAALPASKFPPA
jgi:hypothetical protein